MATHSGSASTHAPQPSLVLPTSKQSKYSTEISQMLFVFGEVKNPDEQTVRYIEDVVRCQVAELVVQARGLAQKRGLRIPTTEDLIFLIRHDRAKVNRLRTYLGWKDVRKKAREDGVDEKDIESFEPDPNGTSTRMKSQKLKLKIPWELSSIYNDVLVGNEENDDEEEDQDDKEAYEASEKRLREADEITRHMTREEYQHYSDCRQASFTYRKAKRFREFVGLSNYIEGNPKDEVVDVLGFLSYEMVRVLCEKGLAVKREYALARIAQGEDGAARNEETHSGSPNKRKRRANAIDLSDDNYDGSEAWKRPKPIGPFSEPVSGPFKLSQNGNNLTKSFTDDAFELVEDPTSKSALDKPQESGNATEGSSMVKKTEPQHPPAPVENRTPLKVTDVENAYSLMQSGRVKAKMTALRNFTGGFVRTKVSLI
ncbi:hypothetical protein PTTG_04071 [Puccinia triticina 1-1 BBBD Race 1]|uniref:Transcription initiation protein SPT3 n=2 Tax=Puccinia triticina TaxID=208348 RepID=A0A180G6V2_PUCT1|nr:uncharacterized protein PtA15_7A127 [Puccinia triticina]OAV88425.1 hypothetical protein PTTG_04071 [Puccinia triticina 1-1 BBBD Race 1]WAQ86401.1 hypothetical protein PtA15_7A127 [Puccinia triticina]WAR56285.1 hypothetical protein PtB15_7B131 [Puccinia triticina]